MYSVEVQQAVWWLIGSVVVIVCCSVLQCVAVCCSMWWLIGSVVVIVQQEVSWFIVLKSTQICNTGGACVCKRPCFRPLHEPYNRHCRGL